MLNVSTTIITRLIAMVYGINGSQRMNPGDFGDPLTFPVVAPAGQSFHSSREVSQHLLY